MLFEGEISDFGWKDNFRGPPSKTVLILNIKLRGSDEIVADHIWQTVGKNIEKACLNKGDVITFNGRVKEYRKGYFKDTTDYRISNITKIEKI